MGVKAKAPLLSLTAVFLKRTYLLGTGAGELRMRMLLATSEPYVREISQTRKDRYVIPLTRGAWDEQIREDGKKSGGCQGLGMGRGVPASWGQSFWLE